jgi:hypothetical protein
MGPACSRSDEGNPETGPARKRWTRIEFVERYSVKGSVIESEDLSGIACASAIHCLLGADEGRRVQVVELSRAEKTLRAREAVVLAQSGDEIDIEAIATDGAFYYAVGSHGIAKRGGEEQANRFRIYRLRFRPGTGVAGPPLVSTLAPLLRADPVLGRHYLQPLQRKGVNIEGLAVRNGRLFVGLRNPNLGGHAFVLEVGAEDVFSSRAAPPYTLHRLHLGPGLGIRDIVAARSGFLLIAGNAGSEPSDSYPRSEDYEESRGYIMFAWDGRSPDVHKIGVIPETSGKAEAMTILEETGDQVTILILFDGPDEGRPSVYTIR